MSQGQGRALVLGGGPLAAVPPGPWDYVVCADSGARHAQAFGLTPDLITGDFDSLEPAWLAAWQGRTRIVPYPRDKDYTDGELAVRAALDTGAREIVFAGALGGRLDHTLANLGLLWLIAQAGRSGWLTDGRERAYLLAAHVASGSPSLTVEGTPGDIVSILPATPSVDGVWTTGLRWPLQGDTLSLGETRPVSNELLSTQAVIRIAAGAAYVIVTPAYDTGAAVRTDCP